MIEYDHKMIHDGTKVISHLGFQAGARAFGVHVLHKNFACYARWSFETYPGLDITLIPAPGRMPWGRQRELCSMIPGISSYEGFPDTFLSALRAVNAAYDAAWFGKDAPRIRIDDRGVHTDKGFTAWSDIPDE